jgi:hypothetical protein
LVSKLEWELPPHAVKQLRAALLAAMQPPTDRQSHAQSNPIQGSYTTQPKQPDLSRDIDTARPCC